MSYQFRDRLSFDFITANETEGFLSAEVPEPDYFDNLSGPFLWPASAAVNEPDSNVIYVGSGNDSEVGAPEGAGGGGSQDIPITGRRVKVWQVSGRFAACESDDQNAGFHALPDSWFARRTIAHACAGGPSLTAAASDPYP